MEKIPQGRYTKEFREEAARLVIENGMSVGEVSCSSFFAKPRWYLYTHLMRIITTLYYSYYAFYA